MACGGIEKLVILYEIIYNNVVNKLQGIYDLLEKKGYLIKIQSEIDPNFYSDISKLIIRHDDMVGQYLKKISKYKK